MSASQAVLNFLGHNDIFQHLSKKSKIATKWWIDIKGIIDDQNSMCFSSVFGLLIISLGVGQKWLETLLHNDVID